MGAVFTVGYEARTADQFVRHLKNHEIEVLIDVRENPVSRKKGFSKNQLSELLHSEGIRYIHARELGSPRHLRVQLDEDNDTESFFREYAKHLEQHLDILMHLYQEVIATGTACLMCMERRPEDCHRSVIAERLRQISGNGLQVMHI